MIIERPLYLKQLITLRHNGMIKIVTGIRRCGESTPVIRNEYGITTISIYDFLLNENSLDL